MFGDCQVLSSHEGNGNNNNNNLLLPPYNNPNFTSFMMPPNLPLSFFPPPLFTEENNKMMMMMMKNKQEIRMESTGSGSEQLVDGDDGGQLQVEEEEEELQKKQQQTAAAKKKRYHRHTARQIQEMEALFKKCPHPDDKQRQQLSLHLGLKPRQVKFWFQNRRTQMKAQQDRSSNAVLRVENDNLKNENYRLQAALRHIVCPNCDSSGDMAFDEQHLRLENAHLKHEFERVCMMVSQYNGRQIQEELGLTSSSLMSPSLDLDMSIFPRKFKNPLADCSDIINTTVPFIPDTTTDFTGGGGGGLLLIMDDEKSLAMELAFSAVNEVAHMCQMSDPLWLQNDAGKEVLNVEEYSRMFSWPLDQKPNQSHFRIEATRHTAVVIMNSITLVDAFLDANKWMELFPSIVSRAKTLQVLNSDVSGHANGSFHLMYAEHQFLSPLVPSREAHFLRFCHHNVEEGTWAIVDFPFDGFRNNYPPPFPYFKKRLSGCIIQDMPNGYSRVTWIEHVEVEENPVHQIFSQFVESDEAFGARRWLAVLQRQCERIASQMARNITDVGVIPSPEARRNLMNLSQRMIRTFSLNISSSCGQSWTALSGSAEDTVRITTRKVTEPGEPNGLILTAVSTSWLPFDQHVVFDLLKDERRRSQLDVLSNGNSLHEVAHIANGSNPGNCISLLRINVASNSSQRVELILQESCADESGSLVVYTTVDVDAIQLAMSGEDHSCIPLIPMGFIIHPMPPETTNRDSTTENVVNTPTESGCLLTAGLQVLASTIPSAKLNLSSVTAVNQHLGNIVQQISTALSNSDGDLTANVDVFTSSNSEPLTAPSENDDSHNPTPP